MKDFSTKLVEQISGLFPTSYADYGNYVVVEEDNIYSLQGNKSHPAPLFFALAPPDIPSEKVPSNVDRWVQSDKVTKDLSNRAPGYDKVVSNARERAEEQLKNLQARRDLIDNYNKKMKDIPPLVMLINPNSFSNSMTKLIIDGSYTRSGYVIEHYGENLDTISCDGRIGGFYGITLDQSPNNSGAFQHVPAISRSFRRASIPYQNLMSLVMIYRTNGRTFIDNDPRRINSVGHIMMFWDGFVYHGNFNSFSISEKEDDPFSLSYSFEFAVSSIDDIYGSR